MMDETHTKDKKDGVADEPDGRWRDVWVEVKRETHGLRNFRAALLGLAYWLTTDPKSRGLLVLVDSRISAARLEKECQLADAVLHPSVKRRLQVASINNGQHVNLPPDLGDDFRKWLDELVLVQPRKTKIAHSFYAILKTMLHQWLLGRGPVTTDWLTKTVGCSYPTAADALRRLDRYIQRKSDRRVELRCFPHDEWAHLVAVSDMVRGTVRFADRSGQPRSPQSLLRRLQRLQRPELAVGGVWGAKHYDSALDIVGNPRLDMCLHCPGGKGADFSFVEQLDPALERAQNHEAAPAMVVHLVERADSFFELGSDGVNWADPVECLLDLHEARLEPQALEFLNFFRPTQEQK